MNPPNKTAVTLFTGCGGADVGFEEEGFSSLWGVDNDLKSCNIARSNGIACLHADLQSIDFKGLAKPYWLHASPPCVNASIINPKQGETDVDIALARSVVRAISVLKPEVFSLENVSGYLYFHRSYRRIKDALKRARYSLTEAVIDAADYGVPQNRKRLILVASRHGEPVIPSPTHAQVGGQMQLYTEDVLQRWVSWSEGLHGLPECEEYELSDRMLRKIPHDFVGTALVSGWNQSRPLSIRRTHQPSTGLTASMQQDSLRPMILTRTPQGVTTAEVLAIEHMAALQTFPKRRKWGVSGPAAFKAVGNAVPPLLMKKIVEANIGSKNEKIHSYASIGQA